MSVTLLPSELTKKQLSEKINEILGINPPIRFERLDKSDLRRLYDLFKQVDSLFWAKISRKALKTKVLAKFPLVRRADSLVDALLYLLKR